MITTRSVFDRQLCTLREEVQQLSEMVAQSLTLSAAALQKHDLATARLVDQADARINAQRFEIEEQAYKLLALQQPNASDMRAIVATVSVVTNLERMGDHAAGIARLVLRMGDSACLEVPPEFSKMADLGLAMLHDSITAFVTHDQILARSVVARDGQVDQLHKQAYERLIAAMQNDPQAVECGTLMLWVSHNLERIADRSANICERVTFLVTGDLVHRHDPMP